MTNRDWLCLALRLFGIWILIQAVEGFFTYLIFLVTSFNSGGGFQAITLTFVAIICRTTAALVLILFAPSIATRFYPSTVSSETSSSELNQTSPLRVGIQLLAVYALLMAVQSGAGVIYGVLTSERGLDLRQLTDLSYLEARYLRSLLTCGLNLAFAAILLMWNDRVITLIEKFRYVPERDVYEPPPIDG